ncbi:LURP-one-related/scramblase family protein [Lacticigenium naphthae]|uniref:LURP-one-related/scramblase family protein n=1 Tax=Lacticigenium naphthae TaxID=515351 RepID=UPI00041133D2|nr:LURP-one-related family protein [Lacticigenium naphthae]
MIRVFMKQEFVSMRNRIIVKDSCGDDLFLIVGKWGRIGDSLSLYNMHGELLFEAKQTILSLFPKFELFEKNKKVGTLVKRPSLRAPYFTVHPMHWLITGNFEEQQYTIRDKAKVITRVEKTYSYVGDFYSLEIIDEEYAPISCILAVIIDHYSINRLTNFMRSPVKGYTLNVYQSFSNFISSKRNTKKHTSN